MSINNLTNGSNLNHETCNNAQSNGSISTLKSDNFQQQIRHSVSMRLPPIHFKDSFGITNKISNIFPNPLLRTHLAFNQVSMSKIEIGLDPLSPQLSCHHHDSHLCKFHAHYTWAYIFLWSYLTFLTLIPHWICLTFVESE